MRFGHRALLCALFVTTACSLLEDLSGLSAKDASVDGGADASGLTACTTPTACPGGFCDCGYCSQTDPSCDQSLRRYTGVGGACVPGIVDVSDRVNHGCMVRTDGTAWCWGNDTDGELGNPAVSEQCSPPWGTIRCNRTPVQVLANGGTPLANVKKIVTAAFHTCALTADQTVWCWGYNTAGQLGNGQSGASAASEVPVHVQTASGVLGGVSAITAGYFATCAVVSGGAVWCWGDNSHLQIGNASVGAFSDVAVQVGSLTGATSISAGSSHFCVGTSAHTAWCWGRGNVLQLGNGAFSDTSTPAQVAFPADAGTVQVQDIGLGNYFSCAHTGLPAEVWCWGENRFGSLGSIINQTSANPSQVALSPAQETIGLNHVEGGDDHACIRISNSDLYCWGGNESGQLANVVVPTDGGTILPTLVYSDVAIFSAGFQHTCALTNKNDLLCWGANPCGELGDGTTTPHSAPTLVQQACP